MLSWARSFFQSRALGSTPETPNFNNLEERKRILIETGGSSLVLTKVRGRR